MLLSASACGEKKAIVEPDDESIAVLRAQVDGVAFLGANELYAQHVNGILAIAARDSDGRTIHITVLNQLKPEVVDIGKGSVNSAVVSLRGAFWRTNIEGGTGSVTVSKVGAFGARGTFSFKATAVPNTKATGTRFVTGQFNVLYQLASGSIFGRDAVQYASMQPGTHVTRRQ